MALRSGMAGVLVIGSGAFSVGEVTSRSMRVIVRWTLPLASEAVSVMGPSEAIVTGRWAVQLPAVTGTCIALGVMELLRVMELSLGGASPVTVSSRSSSCRSLGPGCRGR